jgi:CubicO group peptidase (beta-lactamase class C family)
VLTVLPRAARALDRPVAWQAADMFDAVLADADSVAWRALNRLRLDPGALVVAIQAAEDPAANPGGTLSRDWWLGSGELEARRREQEYVGTEHLLLALLRLEPVAAALAGAGSSAQAVRGQLWRILYDAAPGAKLRAAGPGGLFATAVPPAHPALAALTAEEPIVGASLAVTGGAETGGAESGERATYGWADLPGRVPVTAETRFGAASVTKVATALLVLRLRDRGLLDLDEPAMAKLRSVRLLDTDGRPSAVTVRQLLTHTAGLPWGAGIRHYDGPGPALGELFRDGIRAERPAGEWSYSNLGFAALGALAADLLGKPYDECLRGWVLAPLGLAESADARPAGPDGQPGGRIDGQLDGQFDGQLDGQLDGQPGGVPVARGHVFDAGLLFPVMVSRVPALAPAGGLTGTADAVAVLLAATVGGLLSADSVRQLLTPHAQLGPATWQGLGVRIERHGPLRLVGHGGAFPGAQAAAYACPETGRSGALLANSNTGLLTECLRPSLLS